MERYKINNYQYNQSKEFSVGIEETAKKFENLNQEIDGYIFKVNSSLDELKKLAEKMYNASFHYAKKISNGEYLIMTITNKDNPEENYTNFGLIIKDLKLSFDSSVCLRMYLNLPSPKPIVEVFKKFTDKNDIKYDIVGYIDENKKIIK